MTQKITLKEIMETDVVTQPEDVSIEEAALIMTHTTIGAVLVVNNDNKPTGIFTERDVITKIVGKKTAKYAQLRENMTTDLVTMSPEDTVIDAATIMANKKIRHIVVVGSEGNLQGIISMRDTNKALLRIIQSSL